MCDSGIKLILYGFMLAKCFMPPTSSSSSSPRLDVKNIEEENLINFLSATSLSEAEICPESTDILCHKTFHIFQSSCDVGGRWGWAHCW